MHAWSGSHDQPRSRDVAALREEVGLSHISPASLALLAAQVLLTLLVQQDAGVTCILELLRKVTLLLLDVLVPSFLERLPCIPLPLLVSLLVTEEAAEWR